MRQGKHQQKKTRKRKGRKPLWQKLLMGLGVFVLIVLAAVIVYFNWERAPEITPHKPLETEPVTTESPEATPGLETVDAEAPDQLEEAGREKGVYTILLAGIDASSGNTDTILVGKIDTVNHAMNFVSIPRDTLMNVGGYNRKINSAYIGTAASGGVGSDGLKAQVRKLTGFDVDCYAIIDVDVFVQAVDMIGGVDFEVPMDMDYEDPNQDLYIHLEAGYQHLDGTQAMGLVRFRKGYANADIGRMDVQHEFLKSVMSQFVAKGSVPNAVALIKLLSEHMDTDLDTANMAFFLRQGLLCDTENINFYTMPFAGRMIKGLSYLTVNLYAWLDMVNEYLNPYDRPIYTSDVDIVFYSNGEPQSTSGVLRGPDYYEEDEEEEEEAENTEAGEKDEAAPVESAAPEEDVILVIEGENNETPWDQENNEETGTGLTVETSSDAPEEGGVDTTTEPSTGADAQTETAAEASAPDAE